jgi:hypothetical protein
MVRYSQFMIATVQAVLFTPDASQFSQANVISTILTRYAARYNGELQALPLPDNAPPEIYRVVLQSSDRTYKLQASPARIDSFWDGMTGADQGEAFSGIEVLEHYVAAAPVRVGRLALIVTRIADDNNAPQTLIERFCNAQSITRPFNNSKAFEIHNQKSYELPVFVELINSWVRCKAVEMIAPQQKTVILVEQDINTLEEYRLQRNYNQERLRTFFAASSAEADAILQLYFPGEV